MDLSWKINEKSMKKTHYLFMPVCVFLEGGDPHETSYFTMRKLLFHFLNLCIFSKISSKSWDNTSKTNFCFKKPSTMAPGGPFWLPKRSQIHVGETRHPKSALKKWFSDHAISWTFFKTPKILNNPPEEVRKRCKYSTFCPRTETFRKVNLPMEGEKGERRS